MVLEITMSWLGLYPEILLLLGMLGQKMVAYHPGVDRFKVHGEGDVFATSAVRIVFQICVNIDALCSNNNFAATHLGVDDSAPNITVFPLKSLNFFILLSFLTMTTPV